MQLNFDVKVLEYSHSAGFESYRSKLAILQNQGLPINVEDIIIHRWIRSFAFAMGSTMDPGDEIIIPNHFTQITMVFLLHLELM
jgi:aspartate aminotransferase